MIAAAVVFVAALAGCDDDDRAVQPLGSQPAGGDASTPTGVGEFVVDGVTVRVRSVLDELPEHATSIEFSGTLIDEGAGPTMCIGGVATSYPPQCSGPIVAGLRMGGWAVRAGAVSFGDRTVEVTWPPQDGRVTSWGDRELEQAPGVEDPSLELPAECADIERFVDIDRLASYAATHPDTTGIPYLADGGRTGVLQVSGDIEAARADLREGDAEPCLEQVEYSTIELDAAQRAVMGSADDLYVGSTGSGNALNRVTVDVAVADARTARRLSELVDDPAILVVFGQTTILAGS